MKPAAKICQKLGLAVEVRVLSAHRTPEETAAFVKDAVRRGVKAFICGAGGAAHLAGAVAAHTTRPVIGVPIANGAPQRLRLAALDRADAARHAGGDGRRRRRRERRPARRADRRARRPGAGDEGRGRARAARRKKVLESDAEVAQSEHEGLTSWPRDADDRRGGRGPPPRRGGGLPDGDVLRPRRRRLRRARRSRACAPLKGRGREGDLGADRGRRRCWSASAPRSRPVRARADARATGRAR